MEHSHDNKKRSIRIFFCKFFFLGLRKLGNKTTNLRGVRFSLRPFSDPRSSIAGSMDFYRHAKGMRKFSDSKCSKAARMGSVSADDSP